MTPQDLDRMAGEIEILLPVADAPLYIRIHPKDWKSFLDSTSCKMEPGGVPDARALIAAGWNGWTYRCGSRTFGLWIDRTARVGEPQFLVPTGQTP